MPKLELDRNPSPKSESEDFSTPDERADARNKNHQLDVLKQEQGPIGGLIGCSDSALTIAFVLLMLGGLAIVGSLAGVGMGHETFGSHFEKLVTFELTVAGYVFGKKSG